MQNANKDLKYGIGDYKLHIIAERQRLQNLRQQQQMRGNQGSEENKKGIDTAITLNNPPMMVKMAVFTHTIRFCGHMDSSNQI